MIPKILTILLLAFLITSCSKSEKSDNNSSTRVEQNKSIDTNSTKHIATDTNSSQKVALKKSILTIDTLDGKEIHVDEAQAGLTFQEYKNKTVFLIFFGYRCPPCLYEMPNLIALMAKKHPDLEIIALEVQGLNSEQLKLFKEKKGINYTLAVGDQNNQLIQYIASRAGWQGSIPFFLAFDKKGTVKVVHVGALGAKELDSVYNNLK